MQIDKSWYAELAPIGLSVAKGRVTDFGRHGEEGRIGVAEVEAVIDLSNSPRLTSCAQRTHPFKLALSIVDIPSFSWRVGLLGRRGLSESVK